MSLYLNSRYSLQAEHFHSQTKPRINWREIDLEQNCKSADQTTQFTYPTSCMQNLISNAVPMSMLKSHYPDRDWSLINAYKNLNIKRGVDFLLTIVDKTLNEHFLMKIENSLKIQKAQVAMTSHASKKKVVILAETWNLEESVNKLANLYLDILNDQDKVIISVRFAVLFSIHIVIFSHQKPKVTPELLDVMYTIKQEFSENSNITIIQAYNTDNVRAVLGGEVLAHLQSEDIIFLFDSKFKLKYSFIETCYFYVQKNTQILTTLSHKVPNAKNRDDSNIVCLSVNDYVNVLELNPELKTNNLGDIVQYYIKSELHIIRLPVIGG